MEEKVLEWIARAGLLAEGDTVVAALSGGADSVALFHLLCGHRKTLGIELRAAHFEHGLRGGESLRDAAFVQSLCAREGIPLHLGHGGMDPAQKPAGESVEAWARRLRYGFFRRVAGEVSDAMEGGAVKVATAHTLTDNAETVLFHAIRGSGTRGLSGIAAKRELFIRPLLCVSRREVEAYCAKKELSYVEDSTNADTGYTRNLLRREVMPLLERAHGGAAQNLARLAAEMAEVDGLLAEMAAPLFLEPSPDGGIFLDAEGLRMAPRAVAHKALATAIGSAVDRAAVERAEEVLYGRARGAQMPGGRAVRLADGRLCFGRETADEGIAEAFGYEIPLRVGTHELPGGYRLSVAVCDVEEGERPPLSFCDGEKNTKKGLTFLADYGRIHCGVFRTRRSFDVFSFPARGVSKTLKKWMNEEKMDPVRRAGLPLLADPAGGGVYWIWGEGFSAAVQPGEHTSKLLVIHQETP